MPIGIGAREYLEGKVDIRCLGLSGWINLTSGEIKLEIHSILPFALRENTKWGFCEECNHIDHFQVAPDQ